LSQDFQQFLFLIPGELLLKYPHHVLLDIVCFLQRLPSGEGLPARGLVLPVEFFEGNAFGPRDQLSHLTVVVGGAVERASAACGAYGIPPGDQMPLLPAQKFNASASWQKYAR
jgi:hypothetical protein